MNETVKEAENMYKDYIVYGMGKSELVKLVHKLYYAMQVLKESQK